MKGKIMKKKKTTNINIERMFAYFVCVVTCYERGESVVRWGYEFFFVLERGKKRETFLRFKRERGIWWREIESTFRRL